MLLLALRSRCTEEVVAGVTEANFYFSKIEVEGLTNPRLIQLTAEDSFSRGYKVECLIVAVGQSNLLTNELIQSQAKVSVNDKEGLVSYWNGIVTEASIKDQDVDNVLVSCLIEPSSIKLEHDLNRKIFQDLSAVDIFEALIADTNMMTDVQQLNGTYGPRNYAVQYDETSLDFLQGLLSREGIGFYFKHNGSRSQLILCDEKTCYLGADGSFGSSAAEISYENDGRDHHSGFYDFVELASLVNNSVKIRNFDRENADQTEEVEGLNSVGYGDVYKYEEPALTREQLEVRVSALAARYRAASERFQFRSNVPGISPGSKLRLLDHPKSSLLPELVVIEVLHEFGDGGYSNSILAQSVDAPIVLPEANLKKEFGHDLAVVVGPEKEEIWTDSLGRVKVAFRWDKDEYTDENSSCWLPVSQIWAGRDRGAQFIPRVGDEVLIVYQGGNVDSPIIVGSNYHSDNLPPFELPAMGHTSGIFTKTMGGTEEDHSWLSFKDEAEREQVHLKGNRDVLLESRNQSTLLSRKSLRTIVNLDDESDSLAELGEDLDEKYVNGRSKLVVSDSLTVLVGGDNSWANGGTSGDVSYEIAGNSKAQVKGNLDHSTSGNSQITIGGDGTVEISGALNVSVSGDLTIETTGKLVLKGSEISMQSSSGISLDAGTQLQAKGSVSASLEGASTTITGSGSLSLKGASIALSQG